MDNTRIEPWKVRDIIRDRITGHPYSVLVVYKSRGTEVIDLESRSKFNPTMVILPRDYKDFAVDLDMRLKKNSNEWEFHQIVI